jgi:hypothetical protein
MKYQPVHYQAIVEYPRVKYGKVFKTREEARDDLREMTDNNPQLGSVHELWSNDAIDHARMMEGKELDKPSRRWQKAEMGE